MDAAPFGQTGDFTVALEKLNLLRRQARAVHVQKAFGLRVSASQCLSYPFCVNETPELIAQQPHILSSDAVMVVLAVKNGGSVHVVDGAESAGDEHHPPVVHVGVGRFFLNTIGQSPVVHDRAARQDVLRDGVFEPGPAVIGVHGFAVGRVENAKLGVDDLQIGVYHQGQACSVPSFKLAHLRQSDFDLVGQPEIVLIAEHHIIVFMGGHEAEEVVLGASAVFVSASYGNPVGIASLIVLQNGVGTVSGTVVGDVEREILDGLPEQRINLFHYVFFAVPGCH